MDLYYSQKLLFSNRNITTRSRNTEREFDFGGTVLEGVRLSVCLSARLSLKLLLLLLLLSANEMGAAPV